MRIKIYSLLTIALSMCIPVEYYIACSDISHQVDSLQQESLSRTRNNIKHNL